MNCFNLCITIRAVTFLFEHFFFSVTIEPCYIWNRTYQVTPNVCSVLYRVNFRGFIYVQWLILFAKRLRQNVFFHMFYPIWYRCFTVWGNTPYEIVHKLSPSGGLLFHHDISLCNMNINCNTHQLFFKHANSIVAQHNVEYRALSYYCDMTLSQAF